MLAPHEAETLGHGLHLFVQCLAGSRSASPEPGVVNMLTQVLKELRIMSDKFDNEMATLRADIAAQSTVIASATAAFNGLAAKLAAAEASAKAAGATDAQIADVAAVRQGLEANTAALAQAIPQNTPAATEADPAPAADPVPAASSTTDGTTSA